MELYLLANVVRIGGANAILFPSSPHPFFCAFTLEIVENPPFGRSLASFIPYLLAARQDIGEELSG
jgi:hypothetical protein